jgi:hypothetical protein
MEKWTDMLLSLIREPREAAELAFDVQRVREWSRLARTTRSFGSSRWLAFTAIAAGQRDGRATTGNEDLNGRIAAAVLACLPPAAFNSVGGLASELERSLTQVASDAQAMRARPAAPPHSGGATEGWNLRQRKTGSG